MHLKQTQASRITTKMAADSYAHTQMNHMTDDTGTHDAKVRITKGKQLSE